MAGPIDADVSARFVPRQCPLQVGTRPYGGGKTHFLMAMAIRARDEGFAVSFVQCVPDKQGSPVRVDNPLGLYAELMGRMVIGGQQLKGLPALLTAVVQHTRKSIDESGAPDPDAAFSMYLRSLKQSYYSGVYGDFAQVLGHALRGYWEGGNLSTVAQAAEKWLEGRMGSLTREDWQLLGLKEAPKAQHNQLGRQLTLAMAKLTQEAGCHGLALLIDEVETLFTAKGKALQAVLGAMLVMINWAGPAQDAAPIFCMFAATPDIFSAVAKFPALQQRLMVAGAPFESGNVFSPQINLHGIAKDNESLLKDIGDKLVQVAIASSDGAVTAEIQLQNGRLLAQIAGRKTMDIDSRRIFIKTWASLLALQIGQGERLYAEEELSQRYVGDFESIQAEDKSVFEA